MKNTLKITALLLAFLLGSSLFFGCDKILPDNGNENPTEVLSAPDYSAADIGECVRLGEYKNITVEASGSNSSADVALWNKIVSNAEIIKYPDEALSYYKKQEQSRYEYLAEEGKMSYDELLSSLGVTEADIESEAKAYVKSDLVKLAIIETEGLHLTDDEKSRLFDKYVYKFTEIYGYSAEHVRENLSDEIYDAMQYDKMMEFLLINNTVKAITEE